MPHSPLSAVVRHIRTLAERTSAAMLSDRHLLERFIHQRDEAAFALLVRRHGGLVLGVARRSLHDAHAAEDVFQNTFLTLARRAASIRKHEALASWLYGVAARLASQARLQEARRKKRERAALSSPSEDVTEAAAWRELGAVLDEELQRLPEKYRMPLVLIYFAGQTQEAAARQLEWSLGTLRRRVERGKRLLHGKTAATASSDKCVYLWDLDAGRQLRRFQGHERAVHTVAFTRDGKTLLSAGWDNVVRLWDVAGGRELGRLADPLAAGARAFAHPPDGKTVVTGSYDGSVHVWDMASGKPLRTLPPARGPIECLLFSPDDRFLAVSGEAGGTLYVYDWAGNKVIHDLTREKGSAIYNLAFSPDSRSLATLGTDRIARIWEMASGKLRAQFEGHRGAGASVLFSPDGRTLYTGSSDSTILIWDVTGRLENGRLRKAELKPAEVEARWNDLGGADASKAYQAIWTLAAAPRQTLPLLKKHLRAAAVVEEKRLNQLLKDLDDDAFTVRENASKELARQGDFVEPALRKALEENPLPEKRRRIQQLLERLQRSGPELWRQTRMLEVLEQIDAPEARQILEDLAKSSPSAWLRQEAKATLKRWTSIHSR